MNCAFFTLLGYSLFQFAHTYDHTTHERKIFSVQSESIRCGHSFKYNVTWLRCGLKTHRREKSTFEKCPFICSLRLVMISAVIWLFGNQASHHFWIRCVSRIRGCGQCISRSEPEESIQVHKRGNMCFEKRNPFIFVYGWQWWHSFQIELLYK